MRLLLNQCNAGRINSPQAGLLQEFLKVTSMNSRKLAQ